MNINLGWERAVLGTGLALPESMEEAAELYPSDFSGTHHILWAEMLDLHKKQALDFRAVIEAVRERNQLDRMGAFDVESTGEEYLRYLTSFRGSSMQEYVKRVLDASIKRELKKAAALIVADANNENVSAEEATDEAEKRLLTLRRNRLAGEGVTMGQLANVFMSRVDGFRDGSLKPAWIPPIQAIRNLVDYVDEEDFIVVAGRPGTGKTSLLRFFFAQGTWRTVSKWQLMYNFENSDLEYVKFTAAMLAGLDSAKLKSPKLLTVEELERLRSAVKSLSKMPFIIVSMASPSAAEIDRSVRQHIARYPIEKIGLDYIQLVRNGHKKKNDDVSETTQTLRAIAKRYKVPLLAASQLSREIIHRGENAEPQLSDLRDSGSIEQDATQVWFPWELWHDPPPALLAKFPDNQREDGGVHIPPKAKPIRVKVAKNRNGPIGVTEPFLWNMATNNYTNLTRVQV